MGALVVLLVLTNLLTLGVLAWLLLRPAATSSAPEPDAVVRSALDSSPAPTGALGTRRIITIEILNPIQLAGTRGRMAGIAGSLVPSITKRVVYDQALKQVRRDLQAQHAIADVRLHTIRPVAPGPTATAAPAPVENLDEPGPTPDGPQPDAHSGVPVYFDEIRRLDVDD